MSNIKLFHKLKLNVLLNKSYKINIGETEKSTISTGIFNEGVNESYFSGININFEMIKSNKGIIIESQNTFTKSNRALRQTVTNTTNSSTLLKTDDPTIFMSYESIVTNRSNRGFLYFSIFFWE